MHCCNPSFQSNYANFPTIGHKTVEEYIQGNFRHEEPRCIPNNHALVLVNGSKNRPHFRHKHTADVQGAPMTTWHAEWQSHFPITEVPFKHKYGQNRERRADVYIPNLQRIVELQHSHIENVEVHNRNKDYELHGCTVIWLIDSQDSIRIKKLGTRCILSFESSPWLYESFLSCETVYYDINGYIYGLQPSHIRSHQIDVSPPQQKIDFIRSLQSNSDLSQILPPQSYLCIKQQGAGSGKTFGIMQMLNTDPEFTECQWIILITQQHSAVNVMYNEFMTQYEAGKLYNITLLDHVLENKKHIVHYKHLLTGIETCAVFATVDSFAYAVGQKTHCVSNMFTGIVTSIKEGYINVKKSGRLKFAGVDPFITKETAVIMDETQDLPSLYGEAMVRFVSETRTNLYVVGDRLQSLTNTDNALTYLFHAEAAMMQVVRSEASNVVRRFSDPRLVQFVNTMIPFERYSIPKMTAANVVSESNDPLVIFKGRRIYANQSKEDETVIQAVTDIIDHITHEILHNNRVPEDFLIVTPFTSKNPLVESLQLAINMLWKDTMENNISYIDAVKSKHPYWKSINPQEYTRYSVFHKSQEMGSINLSESNNATRIVSIHSAKGDGRKVVFVIGVTQEALQIFSKVVGNLIYDSLLHVAITRQKEKLYFRVEENGDDIHQRISLCNVNISRHNNTEFMYAKKRIKLSNISDDMLHFEYDDLYENILCKKEIQKLDDVKDTKLLLDMGDHNIRYASMFMNIIVHSCNHAHPDSTKQLYAILGSLNADMIKQIFEWKEYITILSNNTKKPDTSSGKKCIPILYFKTSNNDTHYSYYSKVIYDSMLRILAELQRMKSRQLRYFCPLECVILYYMIESITQGTYQAITINDLYNIIDTYRQAFDATTRGHEYCECTRHFQSITRYSSDLQRKQAEYLRNHYDRVEHVSAMLDNFVTKYPKVSWLYTHPVYYEGDEFTITKRFPLVGYDKTHVFAFTIKPQFTELNYNDVLVSTLCDTWILGNTSQNSENYKKFHGKQLISCVLSLNQHDVYTIDWTMTVMEHRDIFINMIYKIVFNQFHTKHEQYYTTFQSVTKEIVGASNILEYCKKSIDDRTAPYIRKAWEYIEGQVAEISGKSKKQEIIDKYVNKDTCIQLFDRYLDISLMKCLNMTDDEDEDIE